MQKVLKHLAQIIVEIFFTSKFFLSFKVRLIIDKIDNKNNKNQSQVICILNQGILTEGKRLSTVDLLIKVACFEANVNNIFNIKRSLSKQVSTRRSTVCTEPSPSVRLP
jgi:hypothetical protein